MTSATYLWTAGVSATLLLGACSESRSCADTASCPRQETELADAAAPEDTSEGFALPAEGTDASPSRGEAGSGETQDDADENASDPIGVGLGTLPVGDTTQDGATGDSTDSIDGTDEVLNPKDDSSLVDSVPEVDSADVSESDASGTDVVETDATNPTACGDGMIQAGEECDDGEANDNQGACTATCRKAVCGDGFVQSGEQCDWGAANDNGGTCTESCQDATCGDGFVQAGEECDDGAGNDNEGTCTEKCAAPTCGDGFVQPGEQCDEGTGNDDSGDCTTECRSPNCGDGSVQSGEDCDEGSANDNRGTCTEACQNPECGDGFVQPGEECDNGGANNDNGSCTTACQNADCGDGFVQPGEECDNGPANDDNGNCTETCQNAECGDGFVQPGEECDDGPANDNQGACTESCQNADCGDGFVQAGEECDDSNSNNSDSCLDTCFWAGCGDGVTYTNRTDNDNPNDTEECDDGNSNDGDSCTNTCLTYSCTNTCFCEDRSCAAVDKLTVGSGHGCVLSTNGNVWCWGDNTFGAVGQLGFLPSVPPTAVNISAVVDVDCATSATCAAKSDGSAWCWGSASTGRLGDNGQTTSQTASPVQVRTGASSFLSAVTKIAGNTGSFCAIRGNADGSAWCWGTLAQLPAGTTSSSAVRVDTVAGLTDVAGGDENTFGRLGTGTWYSWGRSFLSSHINATQAGLVLPAPVENEDDNAVQLERMSAGEGIACGVLSGALHCWGYLDNFEALLPGLTQSWVAQARQTLSPWPGSAADVAVGISHLCVVNSSGSVYCTGSNERQALGNSGPDVFDDVVQVSGPSSIVQIDSKDYYTCALSSNDEVWCWGENQPVTKLQPVRE